jgi:hypothetical protein
MLAVLFWLALCQYAFNVPCAGGNELGLWHPRFVVAGVQVGSHQRAVVSHVFQTSLALSSRNYTTPMCSKNNNARFDGESHHGSRPAMTASAENGLNQITKRHSLVIGFHDTWFFF